MLIEFLGLGLRFWHWDWADVKCKWKNKGGGKPKLEKIQILGFDTAELGSQFILL